MPRWMLWLLVAILLMGWGISIRQWDADGLWYDEVWSDYNAGGPPDGPLSPPEIAHRLATEDPDQGLAYPLILAAWSAFAGWTPFAGRALSALVGLIAAALVARLGRRLYSASAGGAAAAIMLLSPFFIYYTHELRVFTIVALSVAGLLWTYLDLMQVIRPGRPMGRPYMSMIGFIISGLGLLYTHYFAATILVTFGLMHGLALIAHIVKTSQKKAWHAMPLQKHNDENGLARQTPTISESQSSGFIRCWLRVSLLLIVTGLLFVPWLPVFMQSLQRTATRDDVHAKSLLTPALIEHVAFYLGSGFAILTAALSGVGLGAAWRRGGWTFWTALTALLAWGVVLGFNAVLQIIEPGRVRYLIVLWPLLALLMGLGAALLIDWLPMSKPMASTLIVGLLALNGLRANVDPDYLARMEQKWTPPWQQMTRTIQRWGGPQDMFLFYAGEDHARHYYPFTFVTRGLPLAAPALITEVLADPTYGPGVRTQIDGALRVWYGVDKGQAERPVVGMMREILNDFVLCSDDIDTPRFSLSLYARDQVFCMHPPEVAYGDSLTLIGSNSLAPNDHLLPIKLLWQVRDELAGTLSLSLQVLDESRQPFVQRDMGLPTGPIGATQETLDLSSIPAGRYRVVLIVYRWQTGERLIGQRVGTGEQGDVIDLGEIDLASGE